MTATLYSHLYMPIVKSLPNRNYPGLRARAKPSPTYDNPLFLAYRWF